MSNESYAQHGEDLRISEILGSGRARYGVDVGANDGQSWSNSYLFGQDGYNLLLVEPMPVYAQRCRDLYIDNDKVVVEEAAVSSTEGRTTFFVNDDVQGDELAMRSSLSREAVPSEAITAIEVRTVPLHRLLIKHNWPSDYAFLTVDAEGFDLDVLETAQLERYRPLVICVEEGDRHDAISRFLDENGYRFDMTLGPNGIYVRLA